MHLVVGFDTGSPIFILLFSMRISSLPILMNLAVLAATAPPQPAYRRAEPARVLRSSVAEFLIPDKYIVKLRGGVDTAVVDSALSMLASTPDVIYTSAGFRGFAGTLDETTLEILQNHPDVSVLPL